jgi:hypothetical protein
MKRAERNTRRGLRNTKKVPNSLKRERKKIIADMQNI